MAFRQVKAFISSSMQGPQWLKTREEIRKILDRTKIIDTFIIENTSASLPSVLTYKIEIETSDIVVFIFEDKLRPAVRDEFNIAYKNNKKMLMFFKDCTRDEELEEFINMVIKMDCCTYKKFLNFSGLKTEVQDSLVNDILRIYKAYSMGLLLPTIDQGATLEVQEEADINFLERNEMKINLFDKKYLNLYKNCKNYLYFIMGFPTSDKFDLDDSSPFVVLGFKIIDWLIGTIHFPWEYLDVVTGEMYDDNKEPWMTFRFKAVYSYFVELNIEKTIALLECAKDKARENKAPTWIINDILIDIRNVEVAKMNNEDILFESEAQNELSKNEELIFYPYIDRLHSNISDKVYKEFFQRRTSSIYTQHLGGNILSSLNDIENMLFVSMSYGSISHILSIRNDLANVLFVYSDIYNSNEFLYQSLLLFILQGDTKAVRNILENNWGKIHKDVLKEIPAIFDLTEKVLMKVQKERMQALLFEKLGYYFDDSLFGRFELLIFEFLNRETCSLNVIESSLKALKNNVHRMDSDKLVDICILLFERKWIRFIKEILELVSVLNWKEIDEEKTKKIIMLLTPYLFADKSGYVIEKQLVISMRKQIDSLTNDWDLLVEKTYREIERQIYNFETKKISEAEVLVALHSNLQMVIGRNKECGKNGVYHVYGNDPLKVIMAIIYHYDTTMIYEMVENEVIEVIFSILINTKQTYSEKNSCVRLLIILKNEVDKNKYEFDWTRIVEFVRSHYATILQGNEMGIGKVDNRSMLEIRMITFLSMLSVGTTDDFILRLMELSNEGVVEEIELVQCLSEFVMHSASVDDVTLGNVLTLLLQKSIHETFEVRWHTTEALWNLSNTRFKSFVHARIFELSEDANWMLRYKIIGLAKKMHPIDSRMAELILNKGIIDDNYVVRKKASDTISELGL